MSTLAAADLAYVPRRLFWLDGEGQRHVLGEDELVVQRGPVVVLAEPGAGKSELFRQAAVATGAPLVTATKWLRTVRPEVLIKPNLPILIDALDEASARRDGDAVQRVLEKLDAAGGPRFILSCRAADWEARAATGIAQDYGGRPLICHLEPFSRAEAEWLLGRLCPDIDAADLLGRLDDKGLGDLAGGPLTLQLVASVVAASGVLPSSRAALYEAAVRALWSEHDPDREAELLAGLHEDDALDAAGAVFATMLMAGREAVSTAGPGQATADALSVHEVTLVPGGTQARAALGSKLFRVEAPGRLLPFHKTVAEYLGARWLARYVKDRARPRLLARLQPDGSVPARVRGLHAWLPHFDQELGRGAIACDPYGVVRYGDGDALPIDQARHLLESLVALSRRDPFFRAQDWSSHPIGALTREDLAGEVDALIASTNTNEHLRALLIEGVRDTPLAAALAPTLELIARGTHRFYRERNDAIKALEGGRDLTWRLTLMEHLRTLGDEDSTRLAVGMLGRVGPDAAGSKLTAALLCADMGLTLCAVPRSRDGRAHTVRSYHRVVDAVSDTQLGDVTDLLADHALLALPMAHWSAKNDLAGVLATLVGRALPHATAADAARLWRWLKPLGKADPYQREPIQAVAAMVAARTDLRRAVQRHVVFDLRPRGSLDTIVHADLWRGPGTGPDHDDLFALLGTLDAADRADHQTRADWLALTAMLRERVGLPADVAETARTFAAGDPELVAHIDSLTQPLPPPHWEIQNAARAAKAEKKQAGRFAKDRAKFVQHRDELRAGWLNEVVNPAQAYLGLFADLYGKSPIDRLQDWLGPELAADALAGFEAVLHRDDLPDPMEVSKSRAENRYWYMGLAALAGVTERFRLGRGLDDVPDRALLLANLHRDFCWRGDGDQAEDIQNAMNDAVAGTPDRYEAWARLRIEPQLDHRSAHIDELYALTHEPRFPDVALRLCREWLGRRLELPSAVERELVDALLIAGDHATVREASQVSRERVLPDREAALFWLAVDWVAEFGAAERTLVGIGMSHPDFLFMLEGRIGLDRHRKRPQQLSVLQFEWLVAEFRQAWPYRSRFGVEDSNDRDIRATELLEMFVDRLAADPSSDAGVALDRLSSAKSDGYTRYILHAAAGQRQLRSETEFRAVTPAELRALLADGPPADIDELRALVLDEVDRVAAKLHGGDTDPIVEFWTDEGVPRDENRCRDRLADLLEPVLERYGVHRIPERDMPGGKRADLGFACGDMQLPMEIKGQWHPEVWDAATGQLDRLYLRDWRAQDRGVYVVLWFGDLPTATRRRLKRPPEGEPPTGPEEMERMLTERVPLARRGSIAIRVLDLTR